VHGALPLSGVVGFTEWFWADPPWPRLSNELFPSGVLFLQCTLVLMAAAVFLVGTRLRWSHAPVAMGLEDVAYIWILMFLFGSSEFRGRI
jgi:hypothetical protein